MLVRARRRGGEVHHRLALPRQRLATCCTANKGQRAARTGGPRVGGPGLVALSPSRLLCQGSLLARVSELRFINAGTTTASPHFFRVHPSFSFLAHSLLSLSLSLGSRQPSSRRHHQHGDGASSAIPMADKVSRRTPMSPDALPLSFVSFPGCSALVSATPVQCW